MYLYFKFQASAPKETLLIKAGVGCNVGTQAPLSDRDHTKAPSLGATQLWEPSGR